MEKDRLERDLQRAQRSWMMAKRLELAAVVLELVVA
jgi:hypothetical protein